MSLDYTIENLRGMVGFVEMARNTEVYTPQERHSFLMFAVMHVCQAAVLGDSQLWRYGMSIHDYKHILIKAVEAIMNGQSIDKVMVGVETYVPPTPINWNYYSE